MDCEKTNDSIIKGIRLVLAEKPNIKWSTALETVLLTINDNPHEIPGFTPRFLQFAQTTDQTLPTIPVEEARRLATERSRKAQIKRKGKHDSKHKTSGFKVNDLVKYRLPSNLPSNDKLTPVFIAPCRVVDKLKDESYRLELLDIKDYSVHRSFTAHSSLLFPYYLRVIDNSNQNVIDCQHIQILSNNCHCSQSLQSVLSKMSGSDAHKQLIDGWFDPDDYDEPDQSDCLTSEERQLAYEMAKDKFQEWSDDDEDYVSPDEDADLYYAYVERKNTRQREREDIVRTIDKIERQISYDDQWLPYPVIGRGGKCWLKTGPNESVSNAYKMGVLYSTGKSSIDSQDIAEVYVDKVDKLSLPYEWLEIRCHFAFVWLQSAQEVTQWLDRAPPNTDCEPISLFEWSPESFFGRREVSRNDVSHI